MDEATIKAVEKLRDIRVRNDLSIRPTKYLRQTILLPDGSERPLKLRYYQIQMVLHLMLMNRFIVGDDMGCGKTIESISSMCYLWEKDPNQNVLVLTKKSVLNQWKEEFDKFTSGVNVFVAKGTKAQRQKVYAEYKKSPGPKVVISGYRSFAQDFTLMQSEPWGIAVFDEATMFKSPNTQIHQICKHISSQAKRVWGLTGTLIKNNLVEGYGIYKVVCPTLFPQAPTAFMNEFCIVVMMDIKGRKIPTIKGYRHSDIERFKLIIEPYYLGRSKHEIASELPPLTTIVLNVGMSDFQAKKYKEALDGFLTVGKTASLEAGEREISKLTAVTYCQEIVNHPGLIGFPEEDSEKLDTLVDLLSDGDLSGKKVIVYTRFEAMVTIGAAALEKAGVKSVRITGKEDEMGRSKSQKTFQNLESGVNVVWITDAGSDAINLQAAEAVVFYDTPFSAGNYLQVIGRMIRIGSTHAKVFAYHLVGTGTIDMRVMEVNQRKMNLIESVIGKRIKGEENTDILDDPNSTIADLFDKLKADAKAGVLRV